jgi:cytochrome P450
MRYVPLGVSSSFARYATEGVDLGDVRIRAGDPVLASIASANRDDEVFDDPGQLNLAGEANAHIGFGHGVHHRFGAQLARMRLQAALGTLLARLPGLDFAGGEHEQVWKSGLIVCGPRGFRGMPVIW